MWQGLVFEFETGEGEPATYTGQGHSLRGPPGPGIAEDGGAETDPALRATIPQTKPIECWRFQIQLSGSEGNGEGGEPAE